MECISISFKSAPEEVRKCFVFSDEEKRKILEQTGQAVVLNTCNRTEIYVTGGENRLLADKSGMEETQLRRISRRFQGKKALEHLYRVTCGMDSMVLGEDEILGQMRQAYLFSCKEGKPGYELNTAFQGALACAKKIKTETEISKASVSIATLVSNEVFKAESGPGRTEKGLPGVENQRTDSFLRVLLIGGSGKMGSIILKNLMDHGNIHVLATKRNHAVTGSAKGALTVVEYGERYNYLEQADVIISATESPHYTLTAGEAAGYLADMDKDIGTLPGCRLISIDDFERLASRNNIRKQQAILDAGEMMAKELDTLYKTLAFHDAAGRLDTWKERFAGCGPDKILYFLRDKLDAASFEAVLKVCEENQE